MIIVTTNFQIHQLLIDRKTFNQRKYEKMNILCKEWKLTLAKEKVQWTCLLFHLFFKLEFHRGTQAYSNISIENQL